MGGWDPTSIFLIDDSSADFGDDYVGSDGNPANVRTAEETTQQTRHQCAKVGTTTTTTATAAADADTAASDDCS